ncbi:LysM peptidoglycan-binding domain-containing protein [Chitinilyticum litopenaei]|uniref:LysM peptidoglycan-binding domain-containing protein n=1 Tax=Chitinilyticum litopenaei TaxID=1121276 RepID=UPI00041A2976|nr:LysM peptidoglycan-binding domain-containing protein [Chitinilyticum litopenaei]
MRKTIISLLLSLGSLAGVANADTLQLAKDAPDRYVVVKGDTLWGISGKFLSQPWRWPEIWQMNKEEIKNPHWIYPGDVILLDRSGAQPRLRLLKNEKVSGRSVKLSPTVRSSPLQGMAIPSIPASAIDPFLDKPLVMAEADYKTAARIGAGLENRVVFGTGDTIYAVDMAGKEGETWQVVINRASILDPDNKEKKIGLELAYLGDAIVTAEGEVTTLKVTKAVREIPVGARLVRAPEKPFINFVPHLPEQAIEAKVLSSYSGARHVGSLSTVVVNRGAADGIDLGTVLFAYKPGKLIKKESKEEADRMTPPVRNGAVFVYRVFPTLSYGLVLDSTDAVTYGDLLKAEPASSE